MSTRIEEARKEYFFELKDVLVNFLSNGTWSTIEETFARVGLEWRPDLEPGWGKPKYVSRVLAEMSEKEIIALAKNCINKSPTATVHALQDALWWYQSVGESALSRVTRDRLLEVLDGRRLHPSMSPEAFLKTFPYINDTIWSLPSVYYTNDNQLMLVDYQFSLDLTTRKEIRIPYSHKELLEKCNFSKWSDPRVFEFFEKLVHPEVRKEEYQLELVDVLNEQLIRDGFKLKCTGFISGYSVFSVEAMTGRTGESPKHLIFASNGPKPEIGFEDAVSNKIAILKYEESCLIYDYPIDRNSGLFWEDLVTWWRASKYFSQTDDSDPRKSLALSDSVVKEK